MLILFLRVFLLYLIVLATLRLMGKRQISELQPFELVVTIMIADLAAQPLGDVNMPLLAGIIPIVVLLFMQSVLSFVSMKSKKARRIICGKPAFIFSKGKINQKNVKEMLISPDDIIELLRGNNADDISDVDYALIETNGTVSIIKKSNGNGIVTSLIENGNLIRHNLDKLKLKDGELFQRMEAAGIKDRKELFWAFVYNGKFYFIKKEANS